MPNYTLPDGLTVKNKLGATSHDELKRLEADFVKTRLVEIGLGGGPKGNFDAVHLKAIHGFLFQDIYDWAGHSRDEKVRLPDGTVATEPVLARIGSKPFMPGADIAGTLDRISKEIRDDYFLRGLPRQEFANRAADIFAAINETHAFREGNGRTQRVFIAELANAAGHPVDFSIISKERMIQASIAANEARDNSMMRRMFDEISNPHRIAAVRPALETMSRHNFPWNENYVASMEPGHSVSATFAGTAGAHFMARTKDAVLIGQTADLPSPLPRLGDPFQATASAWPTPESNPRPAIRHGFSP